MQIGEVLMKDMETRTPWFDRQADNAVFTFELIGITGDTASPDIAVEVLQKNYEETGNGSTVSGGASTDWKNIATGGTTVNTPGFYSVEVGGLEEQVRFKITCNETGVLYRFLPPTWFNTAKV